MAIRLPEFPILNWADAVLPNLEDFAQLCQKSYETIPSSLKELCHDLHICVDEFANDDILEKVHIQSKHACLGCFRKVTLIDENDVTAQSSEIVREIWLYRQPILKRWIDHDEPLGMIVSDVMIGEICHHMGLVQQDHQDVHSYLC